MVPDALTVTVEVTVTEVIGAVQDPVEGLPDGPVEIEIGGKVTVEVTVDVTVTVFPGIDVIPPLPLEEDGPPDPDVEIELDVPPDPYSVVVVVVVDVDVVVMVTMRTTGGVVKQVLDTVVPETVTVDGGGHAVVVPDPELGGEEPEVVPEFD